MIPFSITQIEYALAVDRLKNFRDAAKACGISQPTLSQQIQKLEMFLGTKLFDRDANPIRTTSDGELFLKEAKETVSSLSRFAQKGWKTIHGWSGELRVGLIPTLSDMVLPSLIKSIEKEPLGGVHWTFTEVTTAEALRRLADETLQIAILATPIQNMEFSFRPLYYEKFRVYESAKVNRSHSGNAPYHLSEIERDELWLLTDGHCFGQQIENFCGLKKKSDQKNLIEFRSGHLDTLVRLVDELGGMTFLPERFADAMAAAKRERVRPFARPEPFREISLVCLRSQWLTQILDHLETWIRSAVPKEMLSRPTKHTGSVLTVR